MQKRFDIEPICLHTYVVPTKSEEQRHNYVIGMQNNVLNIYKYVTWRLRREVYRPLTHT